MNVMKRHHFIYTPLLTVLLSSGALAQTPQVPSANSDAAEIAKESVDVQVDVKQLLDEQMEATCRPFDQPPRMLLNMGTAVVIKQATDRDWVKARSLAYDEAVNKAYTNYVVSLGVHITTQTAQHFFTAANTEPPPYDESSLKSPQGMQQLVKKLVALGTGKIDKELKNLGIDPKDYEKAPEPQKYIMLQNSLTKTSMKEAIGSIVGLIPVQTFEGNDGHGNFNVGVCLVASQAMKDLASQILTAHGNIAPDPSKAQDLKILYKDKTQLYRDFGVRRVFDEEGYPAVISFSQWASSYTGSDPVVRDAYEAEAVSTATDLADSQIAEFLKGSVDYKSSSQVGEALEKSVDRFADGYIADNEATKTIIDGAIRDMRKQAVVDIVGLHTLYTWSGNHPVSGQRIVGVIRIWSAKTEKTTREFRDNRTPSNASAPKPPQGNGKAGVTSGQTLVKPDDF